MTAIRLNLILLGILLISGCAADLVREADSTFKSGSYEKSADLYAKYLHKHPDAFLTRRKYGLALLKTGRPKEAVEQFESIIDDHPRDYKSLLHLGLAYLKSGDYHKTLEVWRTYETGGKPLIAKEIRRQSHRLTKALPTISNELVLDVKSAVEKAINAQELRNAYNNARLEACGGG